MSHGKVKTYYLTEEERLAYIAKHPIVATETSPIATFRKVTPGQYKQAASNGGKTRAKNKGPGVVEKIDKEELHRRYMAGEILEDIAAALNIPVGNLNYCISKFRETEPERWPRRVIRKKSPERKTKWE